MEQLAGQKCAACRADAPKATPEEIEKLKPQIPQWTITDVDGIKRLMRTYKFADFKEALAFTNKVGAIAEEEGHHPEIVTGWGEVTVGWWTHKIGGLHVNDFIMAAKTDDLM
jgi:4a-hydroxytetrahydrobiopterin dehydratase